jgi:hypothetical protein
LRHARRRLPGGDHGANDTRPLFVERAFDQTSGVNGSDTGPDDGQEIPSKIRV